MRKAQRHVTTAMLVGAAFALAVPAVADDFHWDPPGAQVNAVSAAQADSGDAATSTPDDFHWD